jgi:peptide/nickel transport system permease protein
MAVVLPKRSASVLGTSTRKSEARHRRLSTKTKVGAAICIFFVLAAIIGPMVAPYDPSVQSFGANTVLHAPSAAHLLGTDSLGRDILSQLLVGLRATLVLGLLVGVIATALAVAVGVSAGFLGGFWDEILSLVSNVFLVLPALPLLIVLIGYLPARGQTSTIFVLAFLGWPWGARVIRAQTLTLRSRDFVAASRETGERTWRIIFFEILPNEISLIAASFVSTILYAIGTSVALAFIGLSNFSQWSLGLILYWAENGNALQLGAWWWFAPAGLCVAVLGMGLVLLNFGIDELGNPRLRDAAGRTKINGRVWRPADPTPVVRAVTGASQAPRGRLAAMARSFSRRSVLDVSSMRGTPFARSTQGAADEQH